MHDDFFKLLKNDHNQVKETFKKLADTSDNAKKTRQKLLEQLKELLIPHLKAEEATFYPVLKNTKQSHEIALQALEEHHIAETVFNELERVPVDQDIWDAKCKVLSELVLHHIEEEESEIFEICRKAISHEKMAEIFSNFQEEKTGFKNRLAA